MKYAYAAAGAIILIFIILILQKKPKSRADYLLIVVNLLLGLFLIADVLVSAQKTSFSLILQNAVPLFLFPSFVFYVLQFLYSNDGHGKGWKLLFAPGVLFLIYAIADHYFFNNYETAESLEEHFNNPGIIYQVFFKGSQVLFIVVLIYIIRSLAKYEERLRNGYSFIETVDLGWLRNFSYIYLFAISITFLLFLGSNLGISGLAIQETFGVVYGILILSVFYLNFEGIKHYTLAQVYGRESVDETEISLIDDPPRETVNRPKPDSSDLFDRIYQHVVKEESFLVPKFGLKDLAEELNESTHQVSEAINRNYSGSFYDLINNLRVERLKKLLEDQNNKQFTILHLGYESGFNSKASMNRIFRAVCGLTPKQYQDSQLK